MPVTGKIKHLLLSVGLIIGAALVSGCAVVGACCAPLAIAVAAAAGKAQSDSAAATRDSSAFDLDHVPETRTLAFIVEGLPRRGSFL